MSSGKNYGRRSKNAGVDDGNAYESAYKYIAVRMRTVSETEKHLTDSGFSQQETEAVINDLKEYGYLDDYQYAVRYYEYNREKHRGMLRAARELAAKGVDSQIIRYAGEDFAYENSVDEFSDALEIAGKEISLRSSGGISDAPDEKELGRIARKLESRGFSPDVILRVIERLRK